MILFMLDTCILKSRKFYPHMVIVMLFYFSKIFTWSFSFIRVIPLCKFISKYSFLPTLLWIWKIEETLINDASYPCGRLTDVSSYYVVKGGRQGILYSVGIENRFSLLAALSDPTTPVDLWTSLLVMSPLSTFNSMGNDQVK